MCSKSKSLSIKEQIYVLSVKQYGTFSVSQHEEGLREFENVVQTIDCVSGLHN